jgi:hypothetical protein
MGNLAEESGRDRAVEDEIAVEELDLFDSLPSSDRWWGRLMSQPWVVMIAVIVVVHLGLRVRIRAICAVGHENGPVVFIVTILLVGGRVGI